jgi:hypothetical protein
MLKAKYLEVFGNNKGVQNNKTYLIKRISYKIQKNALGGLIPDIKTEINRLAAEVNPLQKLKSKIKNEVAVIDKKHRKLPLPGNIIRKIYKGNLVEVKVLAESYIAKVTLPE